MANGVASRAARPRAGTNVVETADLFRISIEPAKLLSATQELALLREAHRRKPHLPLVRRKLARALLHDDRFDEVIALFDPADPGQADVAFLILAHLSRETREDDRRVVEIVDLALVDCESDVTRAQLLADRAKASRRLGDDAGARAALERALVLDPANKDACKRLVTLGFETGDAASNVAMLDRLAALGVSHSRFHAGRALAHAGAGRIEDAREAIGFDPLHHAARLATPEGMDSLDAFNTALAEELLDHPDLRYERYGTASEQTWRIDVPTLGDAPMVRLLLDAIAQAATDHVERIGAIDHPWVRARPAAGMLHCWSVLTEGTGYETWHVHQFGWMSGVYYVRIPPSVATGEGVAGCIGFGLPEDATGEEAAARYGTRIVRPQEGMLMLFPSHTYHRTFPHGAAERRICVAFDIWPA